LRLTASSSGKCGKGGSGGSQTFEISGELDRLSSCNFLDFRRRARLEIYNFFIDQLVI